MNLPAEVKVQRVIVGLEEPTVGRDKQSREAGLPTGPAKRRQTRRPGGVGGEAGAILPPQPIWLLVISFEWCRKLGAFCRA